MTESSTFLAVLGAVWVAIGLFLALVMGRRGYSAPTWLVLGALLGPLAVVLALVSRQRNEKPSAVVDGPPVPVVSAAVPVASAPVPIAPVEPDEKARRPEEKAERAYDKAQQKKEREKGQAAGAGGQGHRPCPSCVR